MQTRDFIGIAALALAIGCGPSADDYRSVDGRVTDDPCTPGQTRCELNSYRVCQNGVFVEQLSCPLTQRCDPQLACVDCLPQNGRTCQGDDVHVCNPDGTVGDLIESCQLEGCTNGACSNDCTATGVQLIYVVDDAYRLWSFDPTKLPPAEPFALIGNLSCQAGPSWPEWGDPIATPFSMSVDRDATAWVLYTSGEIFHVSTEDASCQPTGFVAGQAGFKLFGMGFVSDAAGSNEETLYISGGPVDASGSGNLGKIDKNSLQVTSIGPLPVAEYSPELSGTGDGELYGYYPGTISSWVGEIVKTSGAAGQSWNLATLSGTVRAWAFAHWGGKFYIFITTTDGFFDTAQVILLDPSTGQNAVIPGLEDTGKLVVGAGVSTCAPVYIP